MSALDELREHVNRRVGREKRRHRQLSVADCRVAVIGRVGLRLLRSSPEHKQARFFFPSVTTSAHNAPKQTNKQRTQKTNYIVGERADDQRSRDTKQYHPNVTIIAFEERRTSRASLRRAPDGACR